MYLKKNEYPYQPSFNSETYSPQRRADWFSRNPYIPDCVRPEGKDDSDLCAQWSAVRAVETSNSISRLNAIVSVASLVIASIGTFVVIQSLRHSELSQELARSVLKNSEQASDADLRPWLNVDVVAHRIVMSSLEGDTFITSRFDIKVSNIGKSAAENVRLNWHVTMMPFPDRDGWIEEVCKKEIDYPRPLNAVMPGEIANVRAHGSARGDTLSILEFEGEFTFNFAIGVDIRYTGRAGRVVAQTGRYFSFGTGDDADWDLLKVQGRKKIEMSVIRVVRSEYSIAT